MSIKKKVGLGVASAALGLSLVGGGTWAYFNDEETVSNAFAAGTLDLQVLAFNDGNGALPINFDLSNMKPGDEVTRKFRLYNNGSLAIKDVLLSAKASTTDSDTQLGKFLKQFSVEFINTGTEGGGPHNIVNGEFTLFDLVHNNVGNIDSNYISDNGYINLATIQNSNDDSRIGLPADPRDEDWVKIKITFMETGVNQNEFQGDSANVTFNLEARQWDGVTISEDDPNGTINNGQTRSADGSAQPDPITSP